jgi:MOSC domain-containing protein YiiM
MSEPLLTALCAGSANELIVASGEPGRVRRVMSAIRKQPVSSLESPTPIFCGALGLEGDEQVDLTVHGGQDKALYAYPQEHYDFWRRSLETSELLISRFAQPGALGENLATLGLTEEDVYLGDLWGIGEVTLQVTQPREPCFKFNAVTGDKHASKKMTDSGFSGWYLAVITPGVFKAGDAIHVVPGSRQQTVEQAFKQRVRKV